MKESSGRVSQSQPPRVLHVLFVCSEGLMRSPTAAALFNGRNVAGVRLETDYAGRSIEPWEETADSQARLNPHFVPQTPAKHAPTSTRMKRADIIMAMEQRHANAIQTLFPEYAHKVVVLNIEDIYPRNDPRLVGLLLEKVPRAIHARLKNVHAQKEGKRRNDQA